MRSSRRRRAGVSYLEIMVAMVVLGIGLAGICPLILMQLKLLRKLESPSPSSSSQVIGGVRIEDGLVYVPESPVSTPMARVLQPQPDAWVRRLGLRATIQSGVTPQTLPLPTTPSLQVVAVGDAAFSAPNWTAGQDPAEIGSGVYWRSPGDAATGPASWDFAGISRGYYRVVATWSGDSRNASDATYTLTGIDGSPLTSPAPQDQRAAPLATGLGLFYLDQTLHVELSVSETGRVVADAIRIIPLNKVQILVPVAGTSAAYQVSVGVNPQ
jgi:hypothetical protein